MGAKISFPAPAESRRVLSCICCTSLGFFLFFTDITQIKMMSGFKKVESGKARGIIWSLGRINWREQKKPCFIGKTITNVI